MLNDGPTETLIKSAAYIISIWCYMDGFSSSITVVVLVVVVVVVVVAAAAALIAVNFSFK